MITTRQILPLYTNTTRRGKARPVSESNSDSCPATRSSPHTRSTKDAKIRSALPTVIGGRRPDMPMFHGEGGIAIISLVHLLHNGSADLADECHQRPGR